MGSSAARVAEENLCNSLSTNTGLVNSFKKNSIRPEQELHQAAELGFGGFPAQIDILKLC
jgi:hypothetical protein